MRNERGFESWLVGWGVATSMAGTKLSHCRRAEEAVGRQLDDWEPADVLGLISCKCGPVGESLRSPTINRFANYAHSAKLYVGYRVGLTPPGVDLDRMQAVLKELEALSPSQGRWADAIGTRKEGTR